MACACPQPIESAEQKVSQLPPPQRTVASVVVAETESVRFVSAGVATPLLVHSPPAVVQSAGGVAANGSVRVAGPTPPVVVGGSMCFPAGPAVAVAAPVVASARKGPPPVRVVVAGGRINRSHRSHSAGHVQTTCPVGVVAGGSMPVAAIPANVSIGPVSVRFAAAPSPTGVVAGGSVRFRPAPRSVSVGPSVRFGGSVRISAAPAVVGVVRPPVIIGSAAPAPANVAQVIAAPVVSGDVTLKRSASPIQVDMGILTPLKIMSPSQHSTASTPTTAGYKSVDSSPSSVAATDDEPNFLQSDTKRVLPTTSRDEALASPAAATPTVAAPISVDLDILFPNPQASPQQVVVPATPLLMLQASSSPPVVGSSVRVSSMPPMRIGGSVRFASVGAIGPNVLGGSMRYTVGPIAAGGLERSAPVVTVSHGSPPPSPAVPLVPVAIGPIATVAPCLGGSSVRVSSVPPMRIGGSMRFASAGAVGPTVVGGSMRYTVGHVAAPVPITTVAPCLGGSSVRVSSMPPIAMVAPCLRGSSVRVSSMPPMRIGGSVRLAASRVVLGPGGSMRFPAAPAAAVVGGSMRFATASGSVRFATVAAPPTILGGSMRFVAAPGSVRFAGGATPRAASVLVAATLPAAPQAVVVAPSPRFRAPPVTRVVMSRRSISAQIVKRQAPRPLGAARTEDNLSLRLVAEAASSPEASTGSGMTPEPTTSAADQAEMDVTTSSASAEETSSVQTSEPEDAQPDNLQPKEEMSGDSDVDKHTKAAAAASDTESDTTTIQSGGASDRPRSKELGLAAGVIEFSDEGSGVTDCDDAKKVLDAFAQQKSKRIQRKFAAAVIAARWLGAEQRKRDMMKQAAKKVFGTFSVLQSEELSGPLPEFE